ncbi:hypothetical protein DWV13_12190 [Clostridium botulinum]|nr:hypothetical protein [Clostridium botulinum]
MKLFIKFLFIIEIFAYLFSYIVEANIPIIAILSINLIILIFYTVIKNKYILLNKKNFSITISIIFLFSIFSLIFINNEYKDMILINSIKYLIFILNIYFTSCFIYTENEKEFFYRVIYLTTSLFLIICYVHNFDNFEGIKLIGNILNNKLRYRNSYGLYHFNATGYLCLISLLMWRFLAIRYKDKYKCLSIYGIINIVVIIILISTASRNSILSLILFYLGSNILSNIKIGSFKSINFTITRNIFCILLLCGIVVIVFMVVDIENAIIQTNRLDNYLVNIPTLLQSKRQFIGVGLIDESLFVSHKLYYPTTFIDNWFLYVLLTLGIVGLFMSLVIISRLGKFIFKDIIHNKNEKIYVVMIFVISLFYSMFESCFLAPGTLISYVFWNIYFIFIFEQEKEYKN